MDMALLAGIETSELIKIEEGTAMPSLQCLLQLKEELHLTSIDIFFVEKTETLTMHRGGITISTVKCNDIRNFTMQQNGQESLYNDVINSLKREIESKDEIINLLKNSNGINKP
jgi:hypothetical protein